MKTTILSTLLLFLFACNNNSKETADLTKNNVAPKDAIADSMAKWTRNVKNFVPNIMSDTVNFTDSNGLKQGKWIIFTGKEVKTEFYKDGKLLENC